MALTHSSEQDASNSVLSSASILLYQAQQQLLFEGCEFLLNFFF